jgi:hypothetical protein
MQQPSIPSIIGLVVNVQQCTKISWQFPTPVLLVLEVLLRVLFDLSGML